MDRVYKIRKQLIGLKQVVKTLEPIYAVMPVHVYGEDTYPQSKHINSTELDDAFRSIRKSISWLEYMIVQTKCIVPKETIDIAAWKVRNNWEAQDHKQRIEFCKVKLADIIPIVNEILKELYEQEPKESEITWAMKMVRQLLIEGTFFMDYEMERNPNDTGRS